MLTHEIRRMPQAFSRPWQVFALLGLLALPATVRAAQVVLVAPQSPVVASENFQWLVPLKVINGLEVGIYGDSVSCLIEDLDPGQTHTSRFQRVNSTEVVKVLQSLGQFDSTVVRYQAPAFAEHAKLTFTLYTHTQAGERHQSTATCETEPGITSKRFRSELMMGKSGRVETVTVPEPWPLGGSPGVMIVHPEGTHARKLIGLGWYVANLGATVMLVSQPGYGLSDGKPDVAGPGTVDALSRALDALRRTTGVDSTRIVIWGISTGATSAALLAARRHDITGLVLQSGLYDLDAVYRESADDSLKRALDKEGGGKNGWRKRSPTLVASNIHGSVLLIHGEKDAYAPADQATAFADKLRAAGVDVRTEVLPNTGHGISMEGAMPLVRPFLRELIRLDR
jgi:pimeloyl-ACP methyl ester carboxylesterase